MRKNAFLKPGNRVCTVEMSFGLRLQPIGVSILQTAMDELQCARDDEDNTLTMKKHFRKRG